MAMSSLINLQICTGVWRRTLQSTYNFIRKQSTVENETITNPQEDDDMPITMESPYQKEKEKCILCKYNITPNYKNTRLLAQFQSRYTGRIYERHITGLCKGKQAQVEREIEKAQNSDLMGVFTKDLKYVHDPKLFDINHPFRPHKY